jgi:hypothetical protein
MYNSQPWLPDNVSSGADVTPSIIFANKSDRVVKVMRICGTTARVINDRHNDNRVVIN